MWDLAELQHSLLPFSSPSSHKLAHVAFLLIWSALIMVRAGVADCGGFESVRVQITLISIRLKQQRSGLRPSTGHHPRLNLT